MKRIVHEVSHVREVHIRGPEDHMMNAAVDENAVAGQKCGRLRAENVVACGQRMAVACGAKMLPVRLK